MFRVTAQMELRREGVFTLLETVIQAATAADALTAAAVNTPLPGATLPAGIAFKDTPAERNSRALGIINKFLSAELQMEYVDETNAGALWAKLRARFEEDNRADTAMGVLSNLFTTKLVVENETELIDRTKIETHIGIIKGYFDRLARLKYPFSPDLQPLILLSTLPDDTYWTGIRGNIVSSLGTGMTWDKVRARLLTIGRRPDVMDEESALAAKVQTSTKEKSSGNHTKFCVFHGQNASHTSDECRNLKTLSQDAKKGNKFKSGKKERKRGAKANASAASDSESDEEDNANLAIASVSSKSYAAMSAYISSDESGSKRIIVLDSGASRVMTPNIDWFETGTYEVLNPPRKVRLGNDTYCDAIGIGTVWLSCKTKRGMTKLSLKRALHVPSFGITLISVQKLAKAGYKCIFEGDECIVRDSLGKRMVEAKQNKGLYHIMCTPLSEDPHALFAMDINHLHRISGHTNYQLLQNSASKGRLGEITLTGQPKFCEACTLGKMKKLPFSKSQTKARGPLDIVSSDVGGPVTPAAPGGLRYWAVLVDHWGSYVWVLFAKKKSEIYRLLKEWRQHVEQHFRATVANWEFGAGWTRFFRTDGGGEYTSKQMEAEFKRLGIIHEVTAPYTPEQDGVAERMQETLVTRATTMLVDSRLPRKFWNLALRASAYTINRTPASAQNFSIPYEKLFDRPVNIHHMHRFGCRAYPLIPKEKRHKQKFGDKAKRCVFVGYHENSKAYDLLVINKDGTYGETITSRHVRFDEDEPSTGIQPQLEPVITSRKQLEEVSQSLLQRSSPYYDDDEDITPQQTAGSVGGPQINLAPPEDILHENEPPSSDDGASISHPSEKENPPLRKIAGVRFEPTRKSTRKRTPAKHPSAEYERIAQGSQSQTKAQRAAEIEARKNAYETAPAMPDTDPQDDVQEALLLATVHDAIAEAFAAHDPIDSPTWAEAMRSPEADQWMTGLNEELASLQENNVYEVVPIPKDAKPIRSKVVPRLKRDEKGLPARYKIRIVARGDTQKEGIDYKEVFAPTANLESVRIICALAAKHNLELDQMDVSTAYLNGELEEEIYMMPPDCVAIPEGYCWRLKRALYGLKQAGRTWNRTLDTKLLKLGFHRLNSETCLYVYKEGKQTCFVVVYVDDLLVAATSKEFSHKVKGLLASCFKMRDLGPAKYLLGIEIVRDRKKRMIALNQRQYIDKVLARYGMTDCKPVFTPMATGTDLSATNPDDDETIPQMALVEGGPIVTYQSVVGSSMYAMLGTRADIAHTVGVLGRFSSNPKRHHWAAAKRLLRYLKGTRDWALHFDGTDIGMDMNFLGYSDANWNGDRDTSRSTSGYVFIASGGAIGWSSRRQSMVALSSTESEYIGLANAGQHLAWLRSFFEELGQPQKNPTELRCDNRAAIILSQDPQFRARTQHIQRKYHFVRDDLVRHGECVVLWYPTEEMVADIFTKALPHEKHSKFCLSMGLRPGSSGGVRK